MELDKLVADKLLVRGSYRSVEVQEEIDSVQDGLWLNASCCN